MVEGKKISLIQNQKIEKSKKIEKGKIKKKAKRKNPKKAKRKKIQKKIGKNSSFSSSLGQNVRLLSLPYS